MRARDQHVLYVGERPEQTTQGIQLRISGQNHILRAERIKVQL